MKIALVADIHHGPHSHTKKKGWDTLGHLEAFARRAKADGAELLLDLGDRISDTTHESDVAATIEVRDALASFDGPRWHVIGNHDVNNLSVEENGQLLGQSMEHQVVDLGATRLILWNPDVLIKPATVPGQMISLPPAEPSLGWLVEALNADDRPAIIASHVPLAWNTMSGNFYFENNPELATFPDHRLVRDAVEATGRAALWLSGHVHWTTLANVRNIHHVTMHSFSERFTTFPEPAAAYGMLEIKGDSYTLDVRGGEPYSVTLPFRPSGAQKWLKPMARFTELGDVASRQAHANSLVTQDA